MLIFIIEKGVLELIQNAFNIMNPEINPMIPRTDPMLFLMFYEPLKLIQQVSALIKHRAN